MIDLYTSRRDMFDNCLWWSQVENPDIVSNSELVHTITPTGDFLAKEVNAYQENSQIIAETFMVEELNVTLETADDISAMKRNDLVCYDGVIYRVDNIQKKKVREQRQYRRTNFSCGYYITLRG